MGKFESSIYWKHNNCMDVFFYIISVKKDNGIEATLQGYWMIQGTVGYWTASHRDRINIGPKQYHNWRQYEPSGDERHV